MKNKIFTGMMLLAAAVFTTACGDDDDYSISTSAVVTSITTGDASVTAISATTFGTVQDLSSLDASTYQVGTIYSTSSDPTAGGTRQLGSIDDNGNVTAVITGLAEGTTYHYATYVTLQGKVTKYGEVKTFVATDADVATSAAANITACTAVFAGQATGVNDVLESTSVGFKYATTADGVANGVDLPIAEAAGSFSTKASALLPGTTYYYAAYTKVGDGFILGNVQSFTTAQQEMEYVDLGLSVLWAKYNIGAEKESETGILVGFGDQSFYNRSTNADDYTPWDVAGTDEDIVYNLQIDGENVSKSQSPTVEQVEELLSSTTQEAATVDGVQGIRFTARNGNSIFLPVTGYRSADEVTASGEGYYWTGNVSEINEAYGKTLKVAQSASVGLSNRALGLAVRTVRAPEPQPVLDVDVSKLIVGDIESNGRIRIEIFNLYGAGTANDPGLNKDLIKFEKNMLVRFKISGISGNLKEGAPDSFVAGLEYADDSWDPSLWSGFNTKYDTRINGDGEYTVWMEVSSPAEGAAVFTVDIADLDNWLVDASQVKVESLQLMFDVDDSAMQYYVDNSKIVWGDIESNGRIRVELFNQWGATGSQVDYSDLKFSGYLIVNYTITGISGNLVEGAPASFKAEMCYADADWSSQYWGGNDDFAATVAGDGTYEVVAPLAGDSDNPAVWTIEHYDLGANLVDASKLNVVINKVVIAGKK